MKRLGFVLFMVLICCGAFAQAAEAPKQEVKFTVDEERFYTKFNKETVPEWEKRLEAATGNKMPVVVEWTTFAGDLPAMEYMSSVSSGDGVIGSIETVCGDEVGKSRFSKAVKKIVLKHDRTSKDDKGLKVELAEGTMTFTYNFSLNNITSVAQKLIEEKI